MIHAIHATSTRSNAVPPSTATSPHRRRSFASALTSFLLAALLIGSYLTQGGDPSLAFNAAAPLQNTAGLVDQKPLETARALADQAATPPEEEFARQATQIADNEVDQAFAQAMRQATEHAPPLSGAALATQRQVSALTQRIQMEQQQLKPAAAVDASTGKRASPELNMDTALAEAQLALDQDELEDLQGDLVRLGGDRKARIQAALAQHEAVQKLNDARSRNSEAAQLESPESLRTLPGKVHAYLALGSRAKQLEQARLDAGNAARQLAAQHDTLQAKAEKQDTSARNGFMQGDPLQGGSSGSAVMAQAVPGSNVDATHTQSSIQLNTIDMLHALASQRTSLAQLDRQIHDEQQLVDIYTKWKALALAQRTTVLHRIFQTLLIAAALLAVILTANMFIRRFFEQHSPGRRMHTVETVLTLATKLVGLGAILLVLFGTPRQTPTIIGLATAGLTVALKDFIIAFFGWFVLMGKNGVRVGDWVEINGVNGEVVELGILRTVLLETGNWTESAQPTGRRVTFMNGYAIEGRFFNFSTTGQWLWDELRVTVPAGLAAYEKVDAIRRIVEERTSQDVAEAEKEWQRATHSHISGSSLRATPSVDLRPTPDAIQVCVRYITRVRERAQVRSELNEKAIGILHFPDRAAAPQKAASRAAVNKDLP